MTPEQIARVRAARWDGKMAAPADRFWSKVKRTDGCWEWTAAKRGDGYGLFWWNGKVQSAHRISLELHGIEIPDGMVADHECRNRGCVKPTHLRIVTPRQNTLENNDSPFAINNRKTECVHGHPLEGENLAIERSRGGLPTRVCLTCTPSSWRYAVVKRDPPPRARGPRVWLGPFIQAST